MNLKFRYPDSDIHHNASGLTQGLHFCAIVCLKNSIKYCLGYSIRQLQQYKDMSYHNSKLNSQKVSEKAINQSMLRITTIQEIQYTYHAVCCGIAKQTNLQS